jgi:hypothetical protein
MQKTGECLSPAVASSLGSEGVEVWAAFDAINALANKPSPPCSRRGANGSYAT